MFSAIFLYDKYLLLEWLSVTMLNKFYGIIELLQKIKEH